jgi:hypothetical protein
MLVFGVKEFKMRSLKYALQLGCAVGLLSVGVPVVQAQGPAIAYPISNWSYIDHSSTAAEGALRGQAAVISSAGQAEYMDSLAAINYQEAYKRAIENSVAVTKAYYERRELHDEYMKKYGPKPFVGEARRKANEYYQPKRLSTQEFDAQTGKLNWPHILRQEQFAPIKNQIDSAFAIRNAENSGDGSLTYRQIHQLCNSLAGILRDNISRVTTDQYLDAKEFIRSVELEGRSRVTGQPMVVPVNAVPAKDNGVLEPSKEAAVDAKPALGAANRDSAIAKLKT